jgi:excisionase family DNA binding protein
VPIIDRMTNWMTIDQAAAYVRCSAVTLRREVKGGRLAAYRVGGRKALRFRPQDLDAWLLEGNSLNLADATAPADRRLAS